MYLTFEFIATYQKGTLDRICDSINYSPALK